MDMGATADSYLNQQAGLSAPQFQLQTSHFGSGVKGLPSRCRHPSMAVVTSKRCESQAQHCGSCVMVHLAGSSHLAIGVSRGWETSEMMIAWAAFAELLLKFYLRKTINFDRLK
jgi:hypothetical protein